MAHIRSEDPFEFVGKHVVRGLARAPERQEHGWITRYDAEIDCYWLFVPGAGPPKRVTRAEVIKFVTNPNIEMRDGDDDAFPPPIEDTTSRFVDVPVVRGMTISKRRRKVAQVAGKVVCFLPFADCYRVDFADGSSEEIGESAIVDNMIAQLKASAVAVDVDAQSSRTSGRKRPRVDPPSSPELEVPESPLQVKTSSKATVTTTASIETSGITNINGDESPESTHAAVGTPPASESVSILELDDAMNELIPADEDAVAVDDEPPPVRSAADTAGVQAQSSSPQSLSSMPFYIIEDTTHTPTDPLDRRSTAFEYLRMWLLNLLDRREAGGHKSMQQYDMLRNTDIKDRDAICRFIDAGGLAVLNDLATAFIAAETDEGDTDLFFVLKVVAMLPLPTYDQVIEANIGRTLKVVAKSRNRQRRFPPCIAQLAKWVMRRWEKNIKAPKRIKAAPRPHTARPSRPMAKKKKRMYPPVASSIPRGPSLMLAGAPAQNRIPEADALPASDPTPIPRFPRRSSPSAHPAAETPPLSSVASFAASSASMAMNQTPPPPPPPPPAQQQPSRRSGLVPDYISRAEELARTRFTAQNTTRLDSQAERLHYQASHAAPAAGAEAKKNPEQPASAGGPDGVYGRRQRLKFGKKWMTRRFNCSEPPSAVSQSGQRPGEWGGRWPSSQRGAPPPRQFQSPSYATMPRPILRRQSRYNNDPDALD